MSSLDRRLDKLEALQMQRDIEAVCQVARESERHFDRIPEYAAVHRELHALVAACDAQPLESWRHDYTAKVTLAAFKDMRRDEGMSELDPVRADEFLIDTYRYLVVQESPHGRELASHLDALVEEYAMGDNHHR